MIEETWMAKKMEKIFKEEPLGLEAGLAPCAVRQDLRTWVMVLYRANHAAIECLQNHHSQMLFSWGFNFQTQSPHITKKN